MKKTANIQTAEGRKELAAKTLAAIAAKKAEQDAAKDIAAEETKKSIEDMHAAAASEAAANSGKAPAPKPAKPEATKPAKPEATKPAETKEQRENKKQAQFAAIAQDLLKKTKINVGAARTDKAQVKPGDIIAFHTGGEYLQVFKVAFMTPDKSIMLQLMREDSLHNPPDSVGAWTFEDWRVNGLRNVFASRKASRDLFIRVAIFAGV